MYNINKIKDLLAEVSFKTQDVNHNLIYDIFIEQKDQIKKSDFLTEKIKEISENFSWDKEGVLKDNIRSIINENKYLSQVSFNVFIDNIKEIIKGEYAERVAKIIKEEIPRKVVIKKIDSEVVDLIYPFFELIFLLESESKYLLISLGYAD